MEVSTLDSSNPLEILRERVKKEIRKDYEFALFCILPGLNDRYSEIKRMARKIGMDDASIERFGQLLVDSNYWKVSPKKDRVVSNFELLDLGDLTISDYLAMTVCIVSRLSESKSYEYDSLSIVTSRSLVKSFVQEVNQSLKKLYVKSAAPEVEKDCIFSWTHTGVIEIETKLKKPKGEDE